MRCSLIVFSPTGGTEKAARILCSELGDGPEVYDLSERNGKAKGFAAEAREGGVAVIAMPSFGGRVPAVAADRIRRFSGKGIPCVVLCVYGNRAYGDALLEMRDLATTCGFRVIAAVAAVAEHSIIRKYAAGRPDEQDEKSLREIGKRIARKLSGEISGELSGEATAFGSQGSAGAGPKGKDHARPEPESGEELPIPGNRPYQKAGGMALVPKGGSLCAGCGTCAAICPMGAIDKSSPRRTDKSKCISCMRCVAKCPHNARKVNGMMVSAAALAIKKECSVRKECEAYL